MAGMAFRFRYKGRRFISGRVAAAADTMEMSVAIETEEVGVLEAAVQVVMVCLLQVLMIRMG